MHPWCTRLNFIIEPAPAMHHTPPSRYTVRPCTATALPSTMQHELRQRLARVHERIESAARDAGRDPASVRLIAVAKTRSAEEIRALAKEGVTDIGENYLQEALDKQRALADLPLCWHFVGALQSNKTRAVAEHFDWVHSVDRLRLLERLARQRPAARGPLNVCLQVNLDAERSKAGLAPGDVEAVLTAARELPGITVRGLMALPAPRSDAAAQREPFRTLAALARRLEAGLPGAKLDVLSMGMSDDLEAAVAEGATHLRIGTALFGPRPAGATTGQKGVQA